MRTEFLLKEKGGQGPPTHRLCLLLIFLTINLQDFTSLSLRTWPRCMVHHTDQNPARAENRLEEDHSSLALSWLSGDLGFVLAFSRSSSHTSSFSSICLSNSLLICDSHYAWRVLTCLLSSPSTRGLRSTVTFPTVPITSQSDTIQLPTSPLLEDPPPGSHPPVLPALQPSTPWPLHHVNSIASAHQLHAHSPSSLWGKFVASTGQNPILHKNKWSTLLCPAAGLDGSGGGITKHDGQTERPRMSWAPRLTTPCPPPAWCPQRPSGTRDRSEMGWRRSETASPWTVN